MQLKLLKPVLEQHFPGLNICLGCKDDKAHLLRDSGHVLLLSQIKMERRSYGYIREICFNSQTHPVEDLLVESGIKELNLDFPRKARTNNLCVIITEGAYPTKPLNPPETERLEQMAINQGFEVRFNVDVFGASLVMGVESVGLFEAAANGVATKLMPTGLGTRLYKLFFSNGEVLHR